MKHSRLLMFVPLILLAFGCNEYSNEFAGTEPDNTINNERDVDGVKPTPIDQSNEQADIDLVAKIRSEVFDVENMSVNGQNVKIITSRGKVILRGPVASTEEKETIERIAVAAAGPGNVTNELEIDNE